MNELELLQQLIDKRRELEKNRETRVSNSLIKLQEEEISEIEYIIATGDQKRMEMRYFLDQCDDAKGDFPEELYEDY